MDIYSDNDDGENADPEKPGDKGGQKRPKYTIYEDESAHPKSAPPPVTSKSSLPPVPSTPTPHRFDLKKELPPPAGRSPPRAKSIKPFTPLCKRGQTPHKKRIQGSSLLRSDTVRPPFSLAAALSGTLTSSVPKKSSNLVPLSHQRKLSQKPSWDFKIHVDSPHEELTNLMQHSTSVLDLSDDKEAKAKQRALADKEKENIPPEGDAAAAEAQDAAAKNDGEGNEKMENADRQALDELNPADFATKEQIEADAKAAAEANATTTVTADDATARADAASDGNDATTANVEDNEPKKSESETETKKEKKTGEKSTKKPKAKGRKTTAGKRKRNVAPPSPPLETVAEEGCSLSEDEKELSPADRSAISGWIQTGAPALPACDIMVA